MLRYGKEKKCGPTANDLAYQTIQLYSGRWQACLHLPAGEVNYEGRNNKGLIRAGDLQQICNRHVRFGYCYASVALGQHHKSLFDRHKAFSHKYLQTRKTD
jgi:hypothetical protein